MYLAAHYMWLYQQQLLINAQAVSGGGSGGGGGGEGVQTYLSMMRWEDFEVDFRSSDQFDVWRQHVDVVRYNERHQPHSTDGRYMGNCISSFVGVTFRQWCSSDDVLPRLDGTDGSRYDFHRSAVGRASDLMPWQKQEAARFVEPGPDTTRQAVYNVRILFKRKLATPTPMGDASVAEEIIYAVIKSTYIDQCGLTQGDRIRLLDRNGNLFQVTNLGLKYTTRQRVYLTELQEPTP